MQGFITTKDLILHPRLIVEEFGVRVYVRCLVRVAQQRHGRKGPVTFLECIECL